MVLSPVFSTYKLATIKEAIYSSLVQEGLVEVTTIASFGRCDDV